MKPSLEFGFLMDFCEIINNMTDSRDKPLEPEALWDIQLGNSSLLQRRGSRAINHRGPRGINQDKKGKAKWTASPHHGVPALIGSQKPLVFHKT